MIPALTDWLADWLPGCALTPATARVGTSVPPPATLRPTAALTSGSGSLTATTWAAPTPPGQTTQNMSRSACAPTPALPPRAKMRTSRRRMCLVTRQRSSSGLYLSTTLPLRTVRDRRLAAATEILSSSRLSLRRWCVRKQTNERTNERTPAAAAAAVLLQTTSHVCPEPVLAYYRRD